MVLIFGLVTLKWVCRFAQHTNILANGVIIPSVAFKSFVIVAFVLCLMKVVLFVPQRTNLARETDGRKLRITRLEIPFSIAR